MIVREDFEQNTEEWHRARRGKIMGSIAADVIPKPPLKTHVENMLKVLGMHFVQLEGGVPPSGDALRKLLPLDVLVAMGRTEEHKIGFYQLIADWLAIPPVEDDEDPMSRGHSLEQEAIDKLSERIGKKIHRIAMCQRDDEPRIANSPDGMIKNTRGKWVGAVEVKCLKSALHIKAIIENEIPRAEPYNYWSQAMQYFVVNDDLQTLYFVFYDPRLKSYPFHLIEVHRKDVEATVEKLLAYQKGALQDADIIAERLAF